MRERSYKLIKQRNRSRCVVADQRQQVEGALHRAHREPFGGRRTGRGRTRGLPSCHQVA